MKNKSNIKTVLLICLCFTLTSLGYLSWLYHMLLFTDARTADLLSMGAGYMCQGLGVFMFHMLVRRNPSFAGNSVFNIMLAAYILFMVPAMMSGSLIGTLAFGLIMNLICGIIAGYYLYILAQEGDAKWRPLLFGAGYALSTIFTWLISMINSNKLMQSKSVFLLYVVLAIITAYVAHINVNRTDRSEQSEQSGQSDLQNVGTLPMVVITVVFLCIVINMGFSFPSGDLAAGVSIEFSRIFYALGLVIAGNICSRNKKVGALLAIAALITPFITLALSGEPVSHTIFWALNYFLFAFISVYRISIFQDLGDRVHAPAVVAGYGLLFGRIGDSIGNVTSILMGGNLLMLVLFTVILYVITLVFFFLMYQRVYAESPASISEKEYFERFSSYHDLSQREREVLRLVLDEKTTVEIAEQLFVSERTVKFHIHNLLKKTGCKSRLELNTLYHTRFSVPTTPHSL